MKNHKDNVKEKLVFLYNIHLTVNKNGSNFFLKLLQKQPKTHAQNRATGSSSRYATNYSMSHGKGGMAIIFNYDNFHMNHMKPRVEAKICFENLMNVLQDLGFEVNDFKNSTKIKNRHS